MSEKQKNRLTELEDKTFAILKLPGCAVIEILSALGLSGRAEMEFRAQHEAGHTLVLLLEGIRIQHVEIQRLRDVTLNQLEQLFGRPMKVGGEVSTYPSQDQRCAELPPGFSVILYISGLAATKDLKCGRHHFDKIFLSQLTHGRDKSWEDISVPYSYIRERFQAIHNRQPADEKVLEIFYALLDEVGLVFSDEKFARALAKIKELIKKDKLKDVIINDAILDALYSDGFSRQDLDEMKQRILAIDIDRIVQKHGPDVY